ncbi:hypothetical protein NM688_g9200 [Phlebia brevispora]|uniref:Uncharacterized protein n=1 Tax=Phlebia brevispora TaxID=194682 RepID=A0ACC1RIF4_9APHY|nr:hypothetical protein NM688_g9200 [Phlebia brevispora]
MYVLEMSTDIVRSEINATDNDNPFYGNGGGYMASPSGSFGGSPGGASKRAASAHALRPMTIKQLLNATQAHTDAEWQFEGVDFTQVTVVAQVVTIQPQTTNCIYWIEDGTGRMEARHWVDSATNSDDDAIQQGEYIRLMGQIKQFGNKRYLNATHLRPVKDNHEFLFHPLDAITTTLMMERGAPGRPGEQNAQSTSSAARPSTASAYTAQTGQSASNDQFQHLPAIQRQIVEFILAQPAHDDGVHVAAIARAIGGDASAISDALDKLMDDGQVYTTIDESHFNVSV